MSHDVVTFFEALPGRPAIQPPGPDDWRIQCMHDALLAVIQAPDLATARAKASEALADLADDEG